ncbi:hypothetical protein EVAR_82630_1 [Eumeta japonica]|uniref:Uncharacterized protein n=1 Tax=Eumeta variegata TaxID=151549 RepID=A0A4C1VAI8_EUMVA|nr:hypothetical protein EVAR_82630_1 [Eumeta japonica]
MRLNGVSGKPLRESSVYFSIPSKELGQALKCSNVECAGQVKINDHNIQQAESAVQHEINDQQSGDQNLDVGLNWQTQELQSTGEQPTLHQKQARMFRSATLTDCHQDELMSYCAASASSSLEWLDQNEVEGADDFTENHIYMLVQ